MNIPLSVSPLALNAAAPGFSWGLTGLRAILALGLFATFTGVTFAQDHQLDVGVRSAVVEARPVSSDLRDARDHGKIYGIVSVQQVSSENKLVKPVDESAIMQLLSAELHAHGYRLYAPGTNPEILLTVYYGRGFLSNPYQESGGRNETPGSASPASGGSPGAPTISQTGIPPALFNELRPGFEAKLQKAKYEKLYIRVSAWRYPTAAKAKVRQLWNTT
ncbi:MAG: hypothetical protein ABI222_06235, partial [Opitutaceae bacterium]